MDMVKKGWRRERMRQVFLLLAKSQEACSSQSKYCFQVFSSRLFVHLSNLMAKEKTRNRKCAENCGSIGFQASLPSNRHGFQSFSHILFLTECQSALCPQHTACVCHAIHDDSPFFLVCPVKKLLCSCMLNSVGCRRRTCTKDNTTQFNSNIVFLLSLTFS